MEFKVCVHRRTTEIVGLSTRKEDLLRELYLGIVICTESNLKYEGRGV